MAKTKKTNSRPKHSGFEGPAFGTAYPKGTKFKKMPNGVLKPILPKAKEKK